jgi:hypothetical protein
MKTSPKLIRALTIIRDYYRKYREPIYPAAFAREWFPKDYDGWRKVINCGPNGASAGIGLNRWAGGWLGRIHKQGLLRQSFSKYGRSEYTLSHGGSVLLHEKGDGSRK